MVLAVFVALRFGAAAAAESPSGSSALGSPVPHRRGAADPAGATRYVACRLQVATCLVCGRYPYEFHTGHPPHDMMRHVYRATRP